MTDGRPCSRKHPHVFHCQAIKQLRAARRLGGQVVVTAFEDSPGILLENVPQEAAFFMDMKDNLIPDTGPVVEWRNTKKDANLVQHGRADTGEPVTRYSADHGKSWSDPFFDRSGGESDTEEGPANTSEVFQPLLSSSASKKSCLSSKQVYSLARPCIFLHISFSGLFR